MYKVIWTREAQKSLKKIDFLIAEKIIVKIEEYLIKNPRQLGKPSTFQYKGCYRYRFGDFRVIYEVKS